MNYGSYRRLDNQKAKNDKSLESIIGNFVFENFWKKLGASERVNDAYRQIHGIDVQVGDWKVDEKCKYYDSRTKSFMTDLLRYPSFEASMINQKGNVQIGWFLNKDNLTTHYAFIQPFSHQPNPKSFTLNDLDKVNILLIDRKDLDSIKKERDFYSESLELRNNYSWTNERRKKYPGKDYWMTYTPTFHEQPVNIVIPRDTLKWLPHSREFELYRNGKLIEIPK